MIDSQIQKRLAKKNYIRRLESPKYLLTMIFAETNRVIKSIPFWSLGHNL